MAKEQIVLDPVEVADDNRTELALHKDASQVRPEGLDWGDAGVQAYMAEAEFGEVPVDRRVPNRKIVIPLTLLDYNGATFDDARAALQAKVALIQDEGGWLKRELHDGRKLYADIVGATLKLGGSTLAAQHDLDPDVNLELEALPDWYSDEVALSAHAEVSYPELLLLLGASHPETVLGCAPALYWRLGVNGLDDQTANNRDGTAAGGVTVGGATGALTSDTDKATDFDGTDDRITSGFNPFTNGSAITVCGWALRDTTTNIMALFGSGSSTGGAWVALRVSGSGSSTVSFTVNGGTNSVTWTNALTSAGASGGKWLHWALVFDEAADTAELFINGMSQGVKSVTQAYNASPGNFQIGARSGATDPFDGKLDEVAVFARRLIGTEIRQIYNTGLSDPVAKGDRAARCRIALNEKGLHDQRALIWGIRSRHYSPDVTARLVYPASELTPLDTASVQALAGSINGNVVKHSALYGSWVPVLSTEIVGRGHMTHTGTYRAVARVHSATGTTIWDRPVDLRFVYGVGEFSTPEENAPVTLPISSNFALVDMGEVRIDPVSGSAHQWRGEIQARRAAAASSRNLSVDRLYLFPVDEGYGVLRATIDTSVGLSAFVARDGFSQSAGAVTGKAADLGGNWAGAGDTDDATVGSTDARGYPCLKRTAINDSGATPDFKGRFLTLDVNIPAVAVHTIVGLSARVSTITQLVAARFIDLNNFLVAGVVSSTSPTSSVIVAKRVGGTTTVLTQKSAPVFATQLGVLLSVDAEGHWGAWTFMPGAIEATLLAFGRDADLDWTASGAIGSGDVGVYDEHNGGSACTRTYTDFGAWPLARDAVLFSNSAGELGTFHMLRNASGGSVPGAVPWHTGDMPRIPPGRAVEVMIKGSRGDLVLIPDSGNDDLTGQIGYQPSWIGAPSA